MDMKYGIERLNYQYESPERIRMESPSQAAGVHKRAKPLRPLL